MATWISSVDEYPAIAVKVVNHLSATSPFVLWLCGDMGVGKTTMAHFILRRLDVPESVPILSPTYTYLTEYQTRIGLVAHMDLYRLGNNASEETLTSIVGGRRYDGYIVEWPELITGESFLDPTAKLELKFSDDDARRHVTFRS